MSMKLNGFGALILFLTIMAALVTTGSADGIVDYNDTRECVAYVRSRIPSIPAGLFTLKDKINTINDYTPQAGSVAIIDAGTREGHVAVVNSVYSNGIIEIEETNWAGRVRRIRSGTPQDLRVLGCFNPYGGGCQHVFSSIRPNNDHEYFDTFGHRKLYFCQYCGAHDGKIHEEWMKKGGCNIGTCAN